MRFAVKQDVWHRWFAWYPIFWNNEYIWLETVERHRLGLNHHWVYRHVSTIENSVTPDV